MDNLCGMCGIREATWPEVTDFGGGIKSIMIWCQPCADKVIAEATVQGHVETCDKCHFAGTAYGIDVPVLCCDEGKALYAEYQKKVELADDVE